MAQGKLIPISEPSSEMRNELYKVYESVFNSKLSQSKKEGLIDAIFMWETWSWRVRGISYDALRVIKDHDFRPKPKGLVRGHVVDRVTTRRNLLKNILNREEWWKKFWKNDKTEIVTREENNTGQKSTIIEIDYSKGYFANAGKEGFKFRKTIEGEMCRELWDENSDLILGTSGVHN